MSAGAARVAGWLRALGVDLSPFAAEPLRPWRSVRLPWAWLPYGLLAINAVYLLGVEWHILLTDLDVPNRTAATIGLTQALLLALWATRPMAAWWLSLGLAVAITVTVRAYGHDVLWADPALFAYLNVLALAGLRVRPRVLTEIWLLTLLTGAVLAVAVSPARDVAVAALLQMTYLSAIVLVAAGALRGRAEAMRRLAQQQRVNEQERARRTLLEERTRIARELHDVVAHHMSVVAIQAEAAPYRVPDPPGELTRSFATIRGNALDALTELHRILGLLRSDTAPADADADPSGQPAPQPTLDRLDDLVAGVRETGLQVTVETTGAWRETPPGVGLSAYRIVQEALSNVLRHAPGATACVAVTRRPDRLELQVTNGPPAAAATGSTPSGRTGHGLLGMRERVAMLGGRLTAGPRPGGGFAVTAVLPLPSGPAGEES